MRRINTKKQNLRKDLEELEGRIFPRYEELASNVQTERANAEADYENLATAVDEQGEVLHREITAIVKERKADIEETKIKHLGALSGYAEEITRRIDELKKAMMELRQILQSNDASKAYAYTSKNAEFRKLPSKVHFTLPTLSPPSINRESLHRIFGSLPSPSTTTEERRFRMKTPEEASSPSVRPLLEEPRITATIDTEYRPSSVACLSDEDIWTRGEKNLMKLHNLNGKQLKSIQSKSGNAPRDIAVTRGEELVYTDPEARTVDMVKNGQAQTMIRLNGWLPLYICDTASNDLLVAMISENRTQSKIVRYSGSTLKQNIQFDDQGDALYSNGDYKFISENRNLDICMADNGAEAVVVVNESGKLRFRYTGNPSKFKESFDPRGIATDSQGRILIADRNKHNHCIHILDQEGQFLRYIENCDLLHPCGVCVDTRDNLYVCEYWSGKVKQIQYS
jgi:hypothetical protein